MGLGFRGGALLPTGKNWGELGTPELLLQRIVDATPARVGDPFHASLTAWGFAPGGVDILLHPAEEPVEIRVVDGWLEAAGKTSSAGPGYHAFCIDWLERLGSEFDLTWQWENEKREFADETGYAESRDFEKLQQEMFAWLRGLAKHLLSTEMNRVSLALPLGFRVEGDYFAISSLGYWTRAWFQSVIDFAGDSSAEHGSNFFPWWHRERDALFSKNCGLVQAWVDVPWRLPKGDQERRTIENTLASFRWAREQDAEIELPEAEIADLEALLTGAVPPRPSEKGVGFRRRALSKPLTGPWTIDIPGYFEETSERDGTTIIFWDGPRTIRVSSFSFDEGEPEKPELGAMTFERDHLWGTATVEWVEEEGNAYWLLHGEMRTPGSVCVITICFDLETDRDWAIQTWRSMSAPKPATDC